MQNHALFYALFEATILTTVTLSFGYFTGAIRHTSINSPILYSTLEETFAPVRLKKVIVFVII